MVRAEAHGPHLARLAPLAVCARCLVLGAFSATLLPSGFIGCGPDRASYDCMQACSAQPPERCFVSHEARVIVLEPVATRAEFIGRAIERALEYWSAPAQALAGWCIVFTADEVECDGNRSSGCCDWERNLLQLQALDPACPETAQLVHEVGHVLHHDGGHRDSCWCWEREQKATRAIVRAEDASPACTASPWYTWAANFDRGCDGWGTSSSSSSRPP